jgi:predicted DNA-binding protein YlxM (UPF0122 family)
MFSSIANKAKSAIRDPVGSTQRFVGKRLGFYYTEKQYDQLTSLTNQISQSYDINKVAEKFPNDKIGFVRELLIEKNIITYVLNNVYLNRLQYLDNKSLSDPTSSAKMKKDTINQNISNLNNVLTIINGKLQQLDPTGSLREELVNSAKTSYRPGMTSSVLDDLNFWLVMQNVDIVDVIKGLGHILYFLGSVAGNIGIAIMTGQGGKRKRKTRRIKKTKKNRKTRAIRKYK